MCEIRRNRRHDFWHMALATHFSILLLLLLLAAMTYNQVQSFQINDYANHYVDIESTGYRVLYSESICRQGVATVDGWAQQGQLTALK